MKGLLPTIVAMKLPLCLLPLHSVRQRLQVWERSPHSFLNIDLWVSYLCLSYQPNQNLNPLIDILRYHSIVPSICGIPADLHGIGNKRRASEMEDNISDEDEQNQAQFVYYYNSDSSQVRS